MEDTFYQELLQVRSQAELIYTAEQIEAAIDRMAADISDRLSESNPLLLCVLNGGILPFAELQKRLNFPLQCDYVHATRYRHGLSGDALKWLARPTISVADRTVLIVDDILDEGITLAAVEEDIIHAGASKVYTAVLVQKQLAQGPVPSADFVGLPVPDRYVFGYGMDYKGYWRNLTSIYAVSHSQETGYD